MGEMNLKGCGKYTFESFLEKRQEWCKSGSALGAVAVMLDGHNIRLNKRGASSNMYATRW